MTSRVNNITSTVKEMLCELTVAKLHYVYKSKGCSHFSSFKF